LIDEVKTAKQAVDQGASEFFAITERPGAPGAARKF